MSNSAELCSKCSKPSSSASTQSGHTCLSIRNFPQRLRSANFVLCCQGLLSALNQSFACSFRCQQFPGILRQSVRSLLFLRHLQNYVYLFRASDSPENAVRRFCSVFEPFNSIVFFSFSVLLFVGLPPTFSKSEAPCLQMGHIKSAGRVSPS